MSTLLLGTVACSLSDNSEDTGKLLIIDPVEYPMFQFDDEGVPYRWEEPALSADIRADIKSELFGYGWQWMQTNEIDTTGYAMNKDYYTNLDGVSPTEYYFTSGSSLTKYFFADAIPANCYYDLNVQLDAETGVIAYLQSPQSIILRVWSIYQWGDKWYLDFIEPLYYDGSRTHWATSHYVRMTDDELRKVQEQYATNFEDIH